MSLADAYDLVIFDLDGVVYVGTEPVPGAVEALAALHRDGVAVAYATNNASRSGAAVAALLRGLGIDARADEVVTSGQVAATLLATDLPAGSRVLVVGAAALADEVTQVGLTPVTQAQESPVAVVQGFGPEVGWAQLAQACIAIRGGARWVATNLDATVPSAGGPVPGNGSLVAALRHALGGREPDTVVGKPQPALFEVAAAGRRALVVGDRLDTDIEGANRAGLPSLLVLTGVTTPTDVLRAPARLRPTHLAADCGALARPAADSAVPAWTGGAVVAGGCRVEADGQWLRLWAAGRADDGAAGKADDEAAGKARGKADDECGDTAGSDALRALCAVAWNQPQWSGIRPEDDAAAGLLTGLGLGALGPWGPWGPSATSSSAAAAGPAGSP